MGTIDKWESGRAVEGIPAKRLNYISHEKENFERYKRYALENACLFAGDKRKLRQFFDRIWVREFHFLAKCQAAERTFIEHLIAGTDISPEGDAQAREPVTDAVEGFGLDTCIE